MTSKTIVIGKGDVSATVVPSLGGGLARFDFAGHSVFRPWPEGGTDDPFALACNLLIPWSNRISGGGFHADGIFHPLGPNLPGERYPIHGNGFQSEWAVGTTTSNTAELTFESNGPGPYRYSGAVRYAVTDYSLNIMLSATNNAPIALPFGLGLHPWFLRTPETKLQAPAVSVCLETKDHLSDRFEPLDRCADWDFCRPSPLPPGWINNLFAGWPGLASIFRPDGGMVVEIQASPELQFYMLYSPSAESDFFCFEPVSHVVDAHNCTLNSGWNGLRRLAPGEKIHAGVTFTVTQQQVRLSPNACA